MNTTEAIELIARELEGSLTGAEAQQLQDWLTHSPANGQTYNNLRQLYRADWGQVIATPGREFFTTQHQAVRESVAAIEQRQQHKQQRIRAAAVLVLAVLASVFVYNTLPGKAAPHLAFDHAMLNTVADALSESYHVHIEVDEAAQYLRFTGNFVHTDLDTTLAALTRSLRLTLQHHGNTYVLMSRHP